MAPRLFNESSDLRYAIYEVVWSLDAWETLVLTVNSSSRRKNDNQNGLSIACTTRISSDQASTSFLDGLPGTEELRIFANQTLFDH